MKYLLLKFLVCIFVFLDYECSSYFPSKSSFLRYQKKTLCLKSSNAGFDDDFFTNPNAVSKGFLPTTDMEQDEVIEPKAEIASMNQTLDQIMDDLKLGSDEKERLLTALQVLE
mmetsp:Transcript_8844/g.8754  ORF Transcript_8844/g.8754 Transcript_8844/m.8754 type:complete len:113 (+) Transcript_8844:97-435(+)